MVNYGYKSLTENLIEFDEDVLNKLITWSLTLAIVSGVLFLVMNNSETIKGNSILGCRMFCLLPMMFLYATFLLLRSYFYVTKLNALSVGKKIVPFFLQIGIIGLVFGWLIMFVTGK